MHVSDIQFSKKVPLLQPSRNLTSQKLRIAYLVSSYPEVSHTFIRTEILELIKLGHEVVRFSVRKPATALVDPLDIEEERQTTYLLGQSWFVLTYSVFEQLFRNPVRFFKTFWNALSMSKGSNRSLFRHLCYFVEACLLENQCRQHKLTFLHVHFSNNGAEVARIAHRLGGPAYSFTVHGTADFSDPFGAHLEEKAKEANAVYATSYYGLGQLKNAVNEKHWEKFGIIPCALTERFFETPEPIPEGVPTFFCVGRLAKEKGHLILVEALQKIRERGYEANLVIAGDGALRKKLHEKVAKLGLDQHVHFTGFLSEKLIRDYLKRSCCFVLPSFSEGLPVVMMEAFAMGRPVISSNIAGIPELIKENETGWLVPPGCSEMLADKMEEALKMNAKDLYQMGLKGRERVMERHHPSRVIPKLEKQFRGFINGK